MPSPFSWFLVPFCEAIYVRNTITVTNHSLFFIKTFMCSLFIFPWHCGTFSSPQHAFFFVIGRLSVRCKLETEWCTLSIKMEYLKTRSLRWFICGDLTLWAQPREQIRDARYRIFAGIFQLFLADVDTDICTCYFSVNCSSSWSGFIIQYSAFHNKLQHYLYVKHAIFIFMQHFQTKFWIFGLTCNILCNFLSLLLDNVQISPCIPKPHTSLLHLNPSCFFCLKIWLKV